MAKKKKVQRIDEIQDILERIGLFVERDEAGRHDEYLSVKRKAKSKNSMFELIFEKGKLAYLVAGPKETQAVWINIRSK